MSIHTNMHIVNFYKEYIPYRLKFHMKTWVFMYLWMFYGCTCCVVSSKARMVGFCFAFFMLVCLVKGSFVCNVARSRLCAMQCCC